MPKIVAERIGPAKMAPRRKGDRIGRRIAYQTTRIIDGQAFNRVEEVLIPAYRWEDFLNDRRIHYIETDSQPPLRIMIAVGSRLLAKADLPPLSPWGRFRLWLYWHWQKLIGNV